MAIRSAGLDIKPPETLSYVVQQHELPRNVLELLPPRYFVMSVGGGNLHSSAKNRIWPTQNYLTLLQALDIPAVLVGKGSLMSNTVNGFATTQIQPNTVNLVNKTTLDQTTRDYVTRGCSLLAMTAL